MDQGGGAKRRQTRNRVYRCLYDSREFLTKQELSRKLGLSLPTIYQNLGELMDEGLVRLSGEQPSTGGRRAQGFDIDPEARVAVGVSITEQWLRLVVVNLRLGEAAYRKVEHVPLNRAEEFSDQLAREVERLLDQWGGDRSRVLGVGVALAGVLSQDHRKILLAPTLQLRDIDPEKLCSKIPYVVFLENDATCSGYAEWFIRGSRSNMAHLLLENGVGGAVLIGGTPYTGNHGRSGEFGHMCVEPGGLPCNCGKRGCLEAYCSARRISDDLGITLDAFFAGLERHVPEHEALWHDILRHLAIGINNIHMALDCDVVLGGILSEFLGPYLNRLREYTAGINYIVPDAGYLYLSTLRRHTVPLGVALHFIVDFLEHI